MPIVTHPIQTAIPVAGAGKAVPVEQVLQPGAVVDAQVLSTRANLVKIAISGLLLEVMSEVQLEPGTALKLAVSQTADGLRLAIVNQQPADQAARLTQTSGTSPQLAAPASVRVVAPPLQPEQTPVRGSVGPGVALQAAAVAQAVRSAAPVQASLSSLFANLPVIVASPTAPLDVRAAATQLLNARPALTENLNAADLRNAFRSSGVLLEATLAKGATPLAGVPDLKAALTVFRQLVAGWSASAGKSPTAPGFQQGPVSQSAAAPSSPVVGTDEAESAPLPDAMKAQPDIVPVKVAARPDGSSMPDAADLPAIARAAREQGASLAGPAGRPLPEGDDLPKPAAAQTPARATAEPAPPFRGALPSAQPIAAPSIEPDMPAPHLAAQLLDQAEGALARQTLLQVASLPERFDAGSISQPQQRWAFEIPFATPQGTAVAQFEIADEGGGMSETGAPKRVWRARFTLDIETTGPVHALVSLTGGTTAVRIWAERPDTAAQLRDNAQALDSALRLAELQPGDIVVQAGAPPQPKQARAGHFLDRAT